MSNNLFERHFGGDSGELAGEFPADQETLDAILFQKLRRARAELELHRATDDDGLPISRGEQGGFKHVFEEPGQRITPDAQEAAYNYVAAYGAAMLFGSFEDRDTYGILPNIALAAVRIFKREFESLQNELRQIIEIIHEIDVLKRKELSDADRENLEHRVTGFFWKLLQLYAVVVTIREVCSHREQLAIDTFFGEIPKEDFDLSDPDDVGLSQTLFRVESEVNENWRSIHYGVENQLGKLRNYTRQADVAWARKTLRFELIHSFRHRYEFPMDEF